MKFLDYRLMGKSLSTIASLIFGMLLLSFPLVSQTEPKGIHQIEWEYYQQFKSAEKIPAPGEKIEPINRKATENRYLNRAVFGYLPYWKRNSAPQYLQYNLLSHIAIFDWGTSPTGVLSDPVGWPGDWAALINNAHKYGIKVVMCVVEFDDDEMHTLLNNSKNRLTFISNVINEIQSYNLDGVNIDFESPKTGDRSSVMNHFMTQLTDSVHSKLGSEYEVSFAGPAINWGDHWDLAGLADACDYIFIMGYSFWGSWSSTAGPTAPLQGLANSITSSVTREYGDVVATHPEKLILGVPYYGNHWQTQNNTEGSTAMDYMGAVYYSSGVDYFRSYGRKWSSIYKVPWTAYNSGGQWYQVWCDDAESLNLKYNLVQNNNLLGTGMWALGYDSDEMDLWNLLTEKYYRFPADYTIADFEDTLGVFITDLNYSGSTSGIGSESVRIIDSLSAYSGNESMKIIVKDDSIKTEDWVIRLLANKGNKFLNRGLSPNGKISLFVKTSGNNKEIALTVDDMAGGTEISLKTPLINDGDWHEYSWDFQNDDSWKNFYIGNGKINGPIVSIDAIMLYSPEQTDDWTLNIDDINYTRIGNHIEKEPIPKKISLKQNYPNPFNAKTIIEYSVFSGADVSLKVYNIRGQLVKELVNRFHSPGIYKIEFSAENVASGVYIYRLVCGQDIQTGKMTILK